MPTKNSRRLVPLTDGSTNCAEIRSNIPITWSPPLGDHPEDQQFAPDPEFSCTPCRSAQCQPPVLKQQDQSTAAEQDRLTHSVTYLVGVPAQKNVSCHKRDLHILYVQQSSMNERLSSTLSSIPKEDDPLIHDGRSPVQHFAGVAFIPTYRSTLGDYRTVCMHKDA
jgi:hypothetical protein